MHSSQVKAQFAAAGIKVRVADLGCKFRVCRIAKPGVDLAHDKDASSAVAAALGLTDSGAKLGGQFNQAHEMVAFKPGAAARMFGIRA